MTANKLDQIPKDLRVPLLRTGRLHQFVFKELVDPISEKHRLLKAILIRKIALLVAFVFLSVSIFLTNFTGHNRAKWMISWFPLPNSTL